jgi:NTE family protein
MSDNTQRWRQELEVARGKEGSPFAADADIHIISVSLRDLKDAATRSTLLQVPTALTILPWQVNQLQEAGRAALRASPEYQRLRASLQSATARTRPPPLQPDSKRAACDRIFPSPPSSIR